MGIIINPFSVIAPATWTYETEFNNIDGWSGVSEAFNFATDKVTFNIDFSGYNMRYDHTSIDNNAFVLHIPMLVGTATKSGTLGQMYYGLNSLAGGLSTNQDSIGFGIRIGEGAGTYRSVWGDGGSSMSNLTNYTQSVASGNDFGIEIIRTTSTNVNAAIMNNTFSSDIETLSQTINSTVIGLRYSYAATQNEGTTMQFDGSWSSWKMASGVTVAP